jgi:hypothetical protein
MVGRGRRCPAHADPRAAAVTLIRVGDIDPADTTQDAIKHAIWQARVHKVDDDTRVPQTPPDWKT